MTTHGNVQLKLYEFLKGELPPADRSVVEAHLATCHGCERELQSLREAIVLFPVPTIRPSDERTAEFWNALSLRVTEKATSHRSTRRSPFTVVVEWVEEIFTLHPKYAYAAGGGGVAIAIVAGVLWMFPGRESPEFPRSGKQLEYASLPRSTKQEEPGVPVERVNQYFRKSKTLLVGLANLRGQQEEPLDFSAERRVSRDLIREARFLKQQPIDPRTRLLMNDLERILIELANIEEHNDLPDVEILRGGIRQENLLFKIRMAEAMYDSAGFMYASELR